MKKTEYTISFKLFDELSAKELYNLLQLRAEVFVVEQNCPYLDSDGNDFLAIHLLCKENDVLVGYLRILPPKLIYDEITIGRVVVSAKHRNKAIARSMMLYAISKARQYYQKSEIRISAQTYLVDFYKSLGFSTVGEEYLEDNIPHIEMLKED